MAKLFITLYEHDSESYKNITQDTQFLQKSFYKLNLQFKKQLVRQNPNQISDEFNKSRGIIEVYVDSFKARNYVGFAATSNLSIQILPKVFKPDSKNRDTEANWNSITAFVLMINEVYRLGIKEYDLAYLRGKGFRPNLYEIFIFFFAKSLWSEIQRGYYREYVELNNEEKFLRGKLILSRQIRKLPHRANTFRVEVHDFIEDNPLNRIFYASVKQAISKTTWRINKKLLGELLLLFSDVTLIQLREEHFENFHFTRLNKRFKKPFELAKLLFMPLKGGAGEISGFFVDMNQLFELFILRILTKYSKEKGYKLTTNKNPANKKNIFLKAPIGVNLGHQYPDFLIHKEAKNLILDAKYISLFQKQGDCITITSDVVRQLYAYSRLWGYSKTNDQCEKDSKPPVAIIVPSSQVYNSKLLGSAPLEFEFFDGRKLFVLDYNMNYLKIKSVKEGFDYFRSRLDQIME